MENFVCLKCGRCCVQMNLVLERLSALAEVIGAENACFPYSHKNGVCEKLTENNCCSIYDDRPVICNIEKLSLIIAQRTGYELSQIREDMELACEGRKSEK